MLNILLENIQFRPKCFLGLLNKASMPTTGRIVGVYYPEILLPKIRPRTVSTSKIDVGRSGPVSDDEDSTDVVNSKNEERLVWLVYGTTKSF